MTNNILPLTGKLITLTSDSHCFMAVSPKTKTIQLLFNDKTEDDLTTTELEYIDTLITQYELYGYVLLSPIECVEYKYKPNTNPNPLFYGL